MIFISINVLLRH